MRRNLPKTDSFVLRLISIGLAAIGLLLMIAAFTKTVHAPARNLLLPHAREKAAELAVSSALSPTSTHWIIRHFGECCEGNLAAEGPSTYVLLPVLIQGNKIYRSDDGGTTWTKKYPPVDVSQPFGIEGDLNAWGNDIVFFGTEVTDGVAAHSSDRGETWTVVPIPVAFPANDQAWAYLGPFSGLSPAQTAPYVLTGWYRIGSVALFSLDGGLTWPIQTPLVGVDGSGSMHSVCEQTAHDPTAPGDTRNPNANFKNHKSGHYGCWGTDRKFYWTEPANGNLYVCKTDNFGVTWEGIKHPIAPGPASDYVTSHSGFDNKGTLYVLHGDKLYVSFNQGESFAFVHTLPRWGNALLSDSGADQFFVVNCGTIHIGLAEAGAGGNTNIWYLRGSNVDTASPTWDEELVDFVGNNRLDFMQIVLNGNDIPTLSYTAPGVEVTTASRDVPLPFVGPGCATIIIDNFGNAVSRKVHGSAGTFDILLPLTGPPGIECRKGQGPNSDEHDVVVTFASAVTVASVTTSCGTGSTSSTSGNETTIHMTGVANGQCCTITLHNVSDGTNTGDLAIPICFLLGDTSANRLVNSTDVSQTQSQSGQPLTSSNFRTDVNVNGLINSTDVSIVQSKSGTGLP